MLAAVYERHVDGFDPQRLAAEPRDRAAPVRAAASATARRCSTFDFGIETEASAAPALYQWAADFCTGDARVHGRRHEHVVEPARENFFSNAGRHRGHRRCRRNPARLTPTSPTFSVVAARPHRGRVRVQHHRPGHAQADHRPHAHARGSSRGLISDSDLTSFFHDPEFRKLNPHHHWPIQVAAPGLARRDRTPTRGSSRTGSTATRGARASSTARTSTASRSTPAWQRRAVPDRRVRRRASPNGVYFPRAGEEGVAQRLFAEHEAGRERSRPTRSNAGLHRRARPAHRRAVPAADREAHQRRRPAGRDARRRRASTAGFNAMQTSPAGFHAEPGAVSSTDAYPLTKVDHGDGADEADAAPTATFASARSSTTRSADGQKRPAAGLRGAARARCSCRRCATPATLPRDRPTTTTTTTPTTHAVRRWRRRRNRRLQRRVRRLHRRHRLHRATATTDADGRRRSAPGTRGGARPPRRPQPAVGAARRAAAARLGRSARACRSCWSSRCSRCSCAAASTSSEPHARLEAADDDRRHHDARPSRRDRRPERDDDAPASTPVEPAPPSAQGAPAIAVGTDRAARRPSCSLVASSRSSCSRSCSRASRRRAARSGLQRRFRNELGVEPRPGRRRDPDGRAGRDRADPRDRARRGRGRGIAEHAAAARARATWSARRCPASPATR